ncbi:ATP synthase F1 subunit delta [Caldilinea sp.]|uniref:ATP synthase F1 subunit delta n=1 Tax=Caldilinea sp. TaxID=2293560 RepID=UPI002CB6E832|nr:ATP synthase F1 subunit delta [Anaerolineales bacterium]HQY92113.1 ATP synthase F1 subunit delta [Caldilinea sp.]HRA66598.1 ATP synthase F1 subunit delta [Caldilinea sp.]
MSSKQERVNRYAQALWLAQLERWQQAFEQATKALEEKKLAALVADSTKSSADKAAALEKALPADFPAEVTNLLKVMIEAGDAELIDDVNGRVVQVASGKREALKAEVTSAIELTDSEKDKLRKRLAAEYGEGLTFSFGVDPSLMGGLRVRVGDRLIDNSVATRLATLRESIATVVR